MDSRRSMNDMAMVQEIQAPLGGAQSGRNSFQPEGSPSSTLATTMTILPKKHWRCLATVLVVSLTSAVWPSHAPPLTGERRSLREEGTSEQATANSMPHDQSGLRFRETYKHSRIHRKNDRPIKKISLIGERNSGTSWMAGHLKQCFNHTIQVHHNLTRYKHWFQDDLWEKKRVDDTVVVAMFRNPYHWTKAMIDKPWHAPYHYGRNWKEYLELPWTMPRTKEDRDLFNKSKREGRHPREIACQESYNYTRINSCIRKPFERNEREYAELFRRVEEDGGHATLDPTVHRFSSHQPQYELRADGSGEAYESLLEMRRDKIYNFLSIAEWDWIREVITVQYEELVSEGTESILRYLEELTGVEANCPPHPPQVRLQRPLEDEFVKYMEDHVDWEAEQLIGYERMVPADEDEADT